MLISIVALIEGVIQPQAGPSLIKEEWNWIAPNGTSGGTVVGQQSPSLTSYLQQQQQQQQHLPPQQQPPPLQPQGDINMDNISLPNLSDVNLSLLDNHLSENISGLNLLDDVQQVNHHYFSMSSKTNLYAKR